MKETNKKIIKLLLLSIIIFGFFFKISSLNSADLFFDEAKEFLIARGLGDYELTNAQRPFQATLDVNKTSVFQPPLMCALLHFWSNYNFSIPWLKLMPLIFNILSLLFMYYISRLIGFSILWSLAVVAFCSLSYSWSFFALYLRSVYALTIFNSTLLVFLILRIIKNKHIYINDCIILGLGISLACFSSYSFWLIIPLLVCVIAVLIFLYSSVSIIARLRNLLIFLAPLYVTLNYVISKQAIYYWEFSGLNKLQSFGLQDLMKFSLSSLHNSLRLIADSLFWQLFGIVKNYHDSKFFVQASYIISAVFIAACIYLLVFSLRKKRVNGFFIIFTFLYAVASLASLPFLKLWTAEQIRYSVFFSPFLVFSLFIILRFMYQYHSRICRPGVSRVTVLFLITALCLSNLYFSYSYRASQYGFADIRGLLKQVVTDISGDSSSGRVYVYVNWVARDIFRYHYLFADSYLSSRINKEDVYLSSPGLDDINRIEEFGIRFQNIAKNRYDSAWIIWGFTPGYNAEQDDRYKVVKNLISSIESITIIKEVRTNKARALKIAHRIL